MQKKIIASTLAFVLLFGAISPTILAIGEAMAPYRVQNGVLQYMTSRNNGRFTIQTADGLPEKQSDNDLDLLFMRDQLPDTSFTTFRIDGKDYIFGNDYGAEGGVISQTAVTGLIARTVWRVKDVEVTQKLELITDLSNPNVGYVKVSYDVANGSTAAAEVGARILLDTQLGTNDGSAMIVGTSFITNETEYSGENVPTTWRSADQQFAPNVVAYGLLSGWHNIAPDRFVVGHWESLSATKWDYQVNPLLNFNNNKNFYGSADSAVAMYYEPEAMPNGSTRTYETYYGIGSLSDTASEAPFSIQLNSPQKLTVNQTGDGYNESSFTITVTIDNTSELCSDLTDLTVKLGLSDELSIARDDIEIKSINSLRKGDTTSLTFKVEPTVGASLKVAEYGITIIYAADGRYAEASKYVILPSIKGEVPEMQMTEVAPGTLYTGATKKSVVIKGSDFDSLKADYEWQLSVINSRTGIAQEIPRSDIYIEDSALTVQLNDSLSFEAGEYLLSLRSANYGNMSKAITMTNDPEFDRVEYGVLLVGDFTTDDVYDVLLLQSEEQISSLTASQREATLLTIRGEITTYELDGVTYYQCASGSIINSAVMYTAPTAEPNNALTICRYNGGTVGWSKFANYDWFGNNDQSLVLTGDGYLSVGDYYFHYGTFYTTLTDGTTYVLPEVDDDNNIDINPNVGEVPADESEPVKIITPANVIANEAFKLTGALTGMKISINDAVIGKNTVSLGGSVSLSLPWMQLEGDDGDDSGSGHSGFEKVDKANDVLDADSLVALNLQELRYGVNAADNTAELVGLIADGGINLTDDALPLLKAGGASAAFALDSINYDGYYAMMQAGVKVGEAFECNAKVALVFETGGSVIPDDIELVLGGDLLKIPLGAGAFQVGWLTKMGGGIYHLYDTIRGNYNVIPPFSLKLITGYADPTSVALELDTISMEVGIGKIRFEAEDGKIVKLPLLESMYAGFMFYCTEVDGVIYPCIDISAGIELNLLDILKGSGSIWLVADPRIEGIFGNLSVGGKVYAGVFIPSFIPVVGGMELAAIMAELSTYRAFAGIRIIGIPISIGYYWADKQVKFFDTWGLEDYHEAFNIPLEDLENALAVQYAEGGANADGAMLFGSNIRVTYRSDDEPALFGVDTNTHQISVSDQAYSLFEIQYDDVMPNIQVTDPSGNNYTLVENENYRLQTIPADVSESGVDEHYAYISVTDPEDGVWTITTDIPTTVTGMDVLELPEIAVTGFAQNSNDSLTVNWDATAIEPGYTVDVHISAVQDEVVAYSEEQLATMSEEELAAYYQQSADNYDVGVCVAEGLNAASGTANVTVPERLADGQYQVRLVLQDASGENVSSALSTESFAYVNPNTPDPVSNVSLVAAGDGQYRLTFAGADNADGYLVEVLDADGNVIDGLTMTTTDTDLYVGSTYQAATGYDGDRNPTGYETVGTFPGNSYQARVTAYTEKNYVSYESASVTTPVVYLPVPDPAQVTFTVNGVTPTVASGASEVTINQNVAELMIQSDQDVRMIYAIDGVSRPDVLALTAGVPYSLPLALGEGGSTLSLHFVNEQGDFTAERLCVSVDTVAPELMLDQTVVESIAGAYTITGTAETGAAVSVNGQAIAVSNGSFIYHGTGNNQRQSITVTAEDWAGNQTSMYCDVIPAELARFVSLAVQADGRPIDPTQVLEMTKDQTVRLTVCGVAENGTEYLLDNSNVAFSVPFGSNLVSVDADGPLTAESYGDAVVLCEYAVTDGYTLEQSLAVQIASPTTLPDTIRVSTSEIAADAAIGDTVAMLSVPLAPEGVSYSYTLADSDYLAVQGNLLLLTGSVAETAQVSATITAQGHALVQGQYVDVYDPIVSTAVFNVSKRVASIGSSRSLYIQTGVDFADLPLPETVMVALSDRSRLECNVTWSRGAYNSHVAKVYTLKGEIELPPGVSNPADLSAQMLVSVFVPDDGEPLPATDRVIGADQLQVSQATRDTVATQVVTSTVTASDAVLQSAVQGANGEGQPVVIELPAVGQPNDPTVTSDGRPIVRETELVLPDSQLAGLTGPGLIVRGATGTEVELPKALLSALMEQHNGLKLTLGELTGTAAQSAVGNLGTAYSGEEISGNYNGLTTLRFPAPTGVAVADLAVHVRHHDGTAEDIVPQRVVGADGRVYLEISIDRFSTFVVYRPAVAQTTRQVVIGIGKTSATVNGNVCALDAAPYIKPSTSRTMLPIRFITEGLGAKVEWLAGDRQVRITSGERSIVLTIGSKTAYVDGKAVAIDAAAEILRGRTFVPLRFISEVLGADVQYEPKTKSITIKR